MWPLKCLRAPIHAQGFHDELAELHFPSAPSAPSADGVELSGLTRLKSTTRRRSRRRSSTPLPFWPSPALIHQPLAQFRRKRVLAVLTCYWHM